MINKHVVITGSEGFLGRNLIDQLHGKYHYITTIKHKYYDLLKEDDVRDMYTNLKPDILIHLAASVGGIQYNQKNPARLLYENTKMGLNIIEHGKRYGYLEKLVCLGSVCAYPITPPVPFSENDLWNGFPEPTNAGYGISKRVLLLLCQLYRKQYDLNAIYLMPSNMYGKYDTFDQEKAHVIPMLIKRLVDAKKNNEERVTVWGTGEASREFLYASDCAEAIEEAMLKYNKQEPINIGTGFEIKIKYLVDIISKKIGYKGNIEFDSSMPDGQPRRCLNTNNAISEFGWVAKTSLVDGLDKTIEWYLNGRNKEC